VNANNAVRDLYVNKDYSGSELGLRSQPYRTIGAANDVAWSGARLRINPGSYNEKLTLFKKLTLTSNGGIVVIGS
jgi:hypothetical protein